MSRDTGHGDLTSSDGALTASAHEPGMQPRVWTRARSEDPRWGIEAAGAVASIWAERVPELAFVDCSEDPCLFVFDTFADDGRHEDFEGRLYHALQSTRHAENEDGLPLAAISWTEVTVVAFATQQRVPSDDPRYEVRATALKNEVVGR